MVHRRILFIFFILNIDGTPRDPLLACSYYVATLDKATGSAVGTGDFVSYTHGGEWWVRSLEQHLLWLDSEPLMP